MPTSTAAEDIRTPVARPLRRRGAITWRSVLLGSLLVVGVCAIAPFNDYVVANSFIIGSYLPVVMVMTFFVLVVFVNAPLHRWAPRHALGAGELSVVMLMMLAACSIPTQGLLRMFLPTLVGPFYQGRSNPEFWSLFQRMNLPHWLFPITNWSDAQNDPSVSGFYGQGGSDRARPFHTWVVPILGWGVFFAGMWATLVSTAALLREQWSRRERLPFPLAQLQLELVEAPAPGHAFNELFRNRAFWIALGLVVFIHTTRALNQYFAHYIPAIPVGWDLNKVFSDKPLSDLPSVFKASTLYFMFIGVMYFVPSRIGFSIWFVFLSMQSVQAARTIVWQQDTPNQFWHDEHLGAGVMWAAAMLWMGREHWATVVRHLIFGRRSDERTSYRGLAIALISGLVVMIAWLALLGVGPTMILIILGLMLLCHVVVARIVAETGLPIVRAMMKPEQLYTLLPTRFFTGRDIFFGGAFTSMGATTTRESTMVLSMHGLHVVDRATDTAWEDRTAPRPPVVWKLIMLVGWSLGLAFVVGCASSLYCYYHWRAPLSVTNTDAMLNVVALDTWPKENLVTPMTNHAKGQLPTTSYDPKVQFGIGAAIMLVLIVGTANFAWWPVAPVGVLISTMAYSNWIFASVFVGWLAKVLIIRFGGVPLYRAARPAFIGLIFGEALALGIWIVVTLILVALHIDYYPIRFQTT